MYDRYSSAKANQRPAKIPYMVLAPTMGKNVGIHGIHTDMHGHLSVYSDLRRWRSGTSMPLEKSPDNGASQRGQSIFPSTMNHLVHCNSTI